MDSICASVDLLDLKIAGPVTPKAVMELLATLPKLQSLALEECASPGSSAPLIFPTSLTDLRCRSPSQNVEIEAEDEALHTA